MWLYPVKQLTATADPGVLNVEWIGRKVDCPEDRGFTSWAVPWMMRAASMCITKHFQCGQPLSDEYKNVLRALHGREILCLEQPVRELLAGSGAQLITGVQAAPNTTAI